MEKTTKNIFCAKCQSVTGHQVEVDKNGELLFTCLIPGCDRFVKIPSHLSNENVHEYIKAHGQANRGQISLEKSFELLQQVLNAPEVEGTEGTETAEHTEEGQQTE